MLLGAKAGADAQGRRTAIDGTNRSGPRNTWSGSAATVGRETDGQRNRIQPRVGS